MPVCHEAKVTRAHGGFTCHLARARAAAANSVSFAIENCTTSVARSSRLRNVISPRGDTRKIPESVIEDSRSSRNAKKPSWIRCRQEEEVDYVTIMRGAVEASVVRQVVLLSPGGLDHGELGKHLARSAGRESLWMGAQVLFRRLVWRMGWFR